MPSGIPPEFKVGIIGTINRDTVHRQNGSRIDSYGGLLYNLKYLCADNSIIVRPVVNIGYDRYRPITKVLKKLDNIDLSHILKVMSKNNHCHMRYTSQSHRCEFLAGGVPPLTYRRVKPLLDCHLILVNFITGNDITLNALEKLRRQFKGIVYIDIHSLTLGKRKVEGGFHRHLRKPRYWKRYALCADILQLNQTEFELIAEASFSPEGARAFFKHELEMVSCLNITLGEKGSYLVYRKNKDRIIGRKILPYKMVKVYDTTGCGDVFSAGFICEYLKSESYVKAAAEGNRLAAARCKLKTPVF